MRPNGQPPTTLFPLGKLLITPGAMEALDGLAEGQEYALALVARHVTGDWSEMCAEDQESNRQALEIGARIFSAYYLPDDEKTKLWIITEADRSATTVLLPGEY